MLSTGLPVSRLISVEVNLEPLAVPLLNFDTLLILGESDVINTADAVRLYESLASVASDFGTTAPEYLAAQDYFAQSPQPTNLYIGRWGRTGTHGELDGGFLTGAQQAMSNFTGITNGGFHIQVDGAISPGTNVTGINLSGAANLSAVAALVQTAIQAAGGALAAVTVKWTGQQFIVKSGTTGTSSSVLPLTAPTAGTDLSIPMLLSASTAERNVVGIAAETALQCVTRVDGVVGWYGLTFASPNIVDADRLAVAGYIEAANNRHVYGVTSGAAAILDPASSTDIASELQAGLYTRTFVQYSSTSPYAAASFFGRAFTVNFEGSNTTITMMYKQEPTIAPEILTSAQADTLKAKRCNVYTQYNNGANIIEYGVMSGNAYFDEIHGLDWLANRIQTDLFNLLYQAGKIPQTDAGVHVLITGCENSLQQAVNNDLVAPGVWNAPGFGNLTEGDYLPKGWYIFAESVDAQDQADREARISPPIQIAAKLAGAIHLVDCTINVNRALLAFFGASAIIAMLFGGGIA